MMGLVMTKEQLWDRIYGLSYYYHRYNNRVIEYNTRHIYKLMYGLDFEPGDYLEADDKLNYHKEFDKMMNWFVDNNWLILSEDGCYFILNPCYTDHNGVKDEFNGGTKGWACGNCHEFHHGTWDENGNAIEDK